MPMPSAGGSGQSYSPYPNPSSYPTPYPGGPGQFSGKSSTRNTYNFSSV